MSENPTRPGENGAEALDPALLEIVVCPRCHGELEYTADELRCHTCRLGYPIRDGIPVLLVDEARKLD